MQECALCLGTNLGDRHGYLDAMRSALSTELDGPLQCSRVMETEPVEIEEDQGWYLNQVVSFFYRETAQDLLDLCLHIERTLGRQRSGINSPRTADMDILYFGNETVSSQSLTIPHPGIAHRRFVLLGLDEIAPTWIHPVLKKNARQLLDDARVEVSRQIVNFV